ncbi:MAG: glycoside hydrolase family 3 protein, partial [Elusimicrobia bacterium]|nr:glycoside hydrolase family 3 protein [Elusimicrobiota bacterium]
MRATLALFFFFLPARTGSLENLSLEDKVGQILMVRTGYEDIKNFKQDLKAGRVGGVLLQWGRFSEEDTRNTIEQLQKWAKHPLFIAVDYEGGMVFAPQTLGLPSLPTNMMLGAADSNEDAMTLAFLAALELRRLGFSVNFAPVLDVHGYPENPAIGVRSFGEDAENVARLGAAMIAGYKAGGVAAVAKHFPGHGA